MIDSLERCDVELQEELYSNIVLCGGSSLFRGFLPRLEKELVNLLPNTIHRKDLNFVQNTHRRYSSWIGKHFALLRNDNFSSIDHICKRRLDDRLAKHVPRTRYQQERVRREPGIQDVHYRQEDFLIPICPPPLCLRVSMIDICLHITCPGSFIAGATKVACVEKDRQTELPLKRTTIERKCGRSICGIEWNER